MKKVYPHYIGMTDTPDYFTLIETLAEARKINKEARRKWRVRGVVPYKWRIELGKDAAAIGQPVPESVFENYGPNQ